MFLSTLVTTLACVGYYLAEPVVAALKGSARPIIPWGMSSSRTIRRCSMPSGLEERSIESAERPLQSNLSLRVPRRRRIMTLRTLLAVMLVGVAIVATPGCAVTRGQQSVGAYIDDSTITAAVKAAFVDSARVHASAITVETMNGTVLLSGFVTSNEERSAAESLASQVEGVKTVNNQIVVQK
jgi:hyperosmotically inducible protein